MLQIEGPLCRIGKFPASRLGFDLHDLVKKNKLAVDYVHIERSEIEETGEYDLEGLFIRLDSLIREIGARRVVLDTVEALFTGIPNEAILRAELRRLFRWLKERGVTSIITGEKGVNSLTRHGLEEYVSHCVILLDHRVSNQISTRRLRLYVAGQTPKAVRAFENLRRVCEEHLAGRYNIEVIDLLVEPRLERGDQIVAVPTLVRKLPEPVRKIIGDLSDTERLLVGLDLRRRP